MDAEKLITTARQLNAVLDGTATEPYPEAEQCAQLFLCSVSLLILESDDPKAAFQKIPQQNQAQVRELCKLIKSHSKQASK